MKSFLTPASKSTSTPSRSQNILYWEEDEDDEDDVAAVVVPSSDEDFFAAMLKKPERDCCVFAFLVCCDAFAVELRLDMIDERSRREDDGAHLKARAV